MHGRLGARFPATDAMAVRALHRRTMPLMLFKKFPAASVHRSRLVLRNFRFGRSEAVSLATMISPFNTLELRWCHFSRGQMSASFMSWGSDRRGSGSSTLVHHPSL